LFARSWIRRAGGQAAAVIRALSLLLPLAALLALAGAASARADADGKAVAEAVERVYASGKYQTEMPDKKPLELPEYHRWTLSEGVLQVLRVLFWTLAGVGVFLLLVYLANALPPLAARLQRARRKDAAGVTIAAIVDLDRERLGDVLAEADRLARQGAFGEALHLILLHCLNELRQRLGMGVPTSLTSREILRLAPLPDVRRGALSTIVSAVEISHFGGRPVDEATYRLCRQRCEDVVLGGAAP
jgi:uncharacterized protein DUF4129